ncbi:multicopper oxidase domain-containing protein [Streptomyces sp. KL116D]|uniref:multicopper oxidase domain-containing protein n=1 Tax=Streptomyces sp. KL116D TaxID=3045152 RepID=UPI0035575C56
MMRGPRCIARELRSMARIPGVKTRLWRVLVVLGSLVAVLALAIGGGVLWLWNDAKVRRRHDGVPYELAVPPLARSSLGKDGTRVRPADADGREGEFTAGRKTVTWGFFRRRLPRPHAPAARRAGRGPSANGSLEASTVHWHGMHLPAWDGRRPAPDGRSGPGDWTPRWTVDQPAATLWYHPHPHRATEQHVQRGARRDVLVDDARASGFALPRGGAGSDEPAGDRAGREVRRREVLDHRAHGWCGPSASFGDRTTSTAPDRVPDRARRARTAAAAETRRRHGRTTSASRTGGVRARRDGCGGLLERPATTDRIQLSPRGAGRGRGADGARRADRAAQSRAERDRFDAWQKRGSRRRDDDSFGRAAAAGGGPVAALARSPASQNPGGWSCRRPADAVPFPALRPQGEAGSTAALDGDEPGQTTVTRGTTEVWTVLQRSAGCRTTTMCTTCSSGWWR